MSLVVGSDDSEFENQVCSNFCFFNFIFGHFNTFGESGGPLGVRVPAGNAPTRRPAALMRPPYSKSAQKVVQAQIYEDLRKPAEPSQKHLFSIFSYAKVG